MSLYNDISPTTLMILAIIISVMFVIMLIVLFRDGILLRRGRKSMDRRIHRLLLSNMLERLRIPMARYFQKTSDLDRERHIWACERCRQLDDCENMFLGERIKPETFCPNYTELKKLK